MNTPIAASNEKALAMSPYSGTKRKMLNNEIAGWASLNRYSHRAAYDGVADLSIYIERSHRGIGMGKALLEN
jgi:L-amino acid N-acyltransferase YncA